MTSSYETEAAAVAEAMNAVYENKQTNKKDDISGDFSSDTASYPTVKAVKGALAGKLDSTHAGNKGKNVVTNGSTGAIEFENKNEHAHGNLSKDGKVGTDSGKPLITTTGGAVTTGAFGTSAGQFAEGNHTHSGYLTAHQSLDSKTVTLEKQSTAETGYAHTYVLKQGGVALSPKINIPKDFLLQSASMETVGSTPSTLETSNSLTTGDKYLKFVVNTSNTESGVTPLIVPVNDLLDNISYTADGVTLELSNNQFKIKNSGVDTTQIKDGAVTADKIASAVKSSWLSTSDVQSEISAFASALAAAINPST